VATTKGSVKATSERGWWDWEARTAKGSVYSLVRSLAMGWACDLSRSSSLTQSSPQMKTSLLAMADSLSAHHTRKRLDLQPSNADAAHGSGVSAASSGRGHAPALLFSQAVSSRAHRYDSRRPACALARACVHRRSTESPVFTWCPRPPAKRKGTGHQPYCCWICRGAAGGVGYDFEDFIVFARNYNWATNSVNWKWIKFRISIPWAAKHGGVWNPIQLGPNP
jgi:hypothetical protein